MRHLYAGFKVPTRNFQLIIKQSKYITVASHLTYRQINPLARRLEITILSLQCYETLYSTHRPEETFVVYKHYQSTVLFLSIYGWKQEDFFPRKMSIFCIYGWTGIVQISGLFLSFSYKNKYSHEAKSLWQYAVPLLSTQEFLGALSFAGDLDNFIFGSIKLSTCFGYMYHVCM